MPEFSLEQQFTIAAFDSQVDQMSGEQAKEFLKQFHRSTAAREVVIKSMLKQGLIGEGGSAIPPAVASKVALLEAMRHASMRWLESFKSSDLINQMADKYFPNDPDEVRLVFDRMAKLTVMHLIEHEAVGSMVYIEGLIAKQDGELGWISGQEGKSDG